MNYKRLYDSIIKNALESGRLEYTEKHHVVPRCLGGTNKKNNLVKLSAREHFICHYLLTKMYDKFSPEWYKTNHAFQMMNCNGENQERYFNSRLFEATREGRSLAISISQTRKGNSQSGTFWINNGFESKKTKKDVLIPDGWIKGRKLFLSDEQKEKWSIAQKEKLISEDAKVRMSNANKGKKRSEETKSKMSISHKDKKPWNKGKKLSEETKAKMSISHKNLNKIKAPI